MVGTGRREGRAATQRARVRARARTNLSGPHCLQSGVPGLHVALPLTTGGGRSLFHASPLNLTGCCGVPGTTTRLCAAFMKRETAYACDSSAPLAAPPLGQPPLLLGVSGHADAKYACIASSSAGRSARGKTTTSPSAPRK